MKTLKKIEVSPVWVENVPERLEQGNIYISLEYHCAIHLCLCGCGNKVVMPINHISKSSGNQITSGWDLHKGSDKVSFTPSVGNYNFPCKYHYVITNNIANII